MMTSLSFYEMVRPSLYLLVSLSFFTILFMVMVSYWNKVNLLSRSSFIPPATLNPTTLLSKDLLSYQKTEVEVVNKINSSTETARTEVVPVSLSPQTRYSSQANDFKSNLTHIAPIVPKTFTDTKQSISPLKQGFEASPQPLRNVWYAIKRLSGQFRILIIDDDPTNLQVLENQLTLHNYIVTQAMDGKQALEMIYGGQPFDLVIVDVMMPLMSGYEVCRELRKTYSAHHLPVMMLTAKNQESDLVMGFQSGANDYLSKPFSKEELLTRIQTHLLLSKINQAYSRFVPHEFIQMLGQDSVVDIQLADQIKKEVTLLFSDIRSFTRLSEQMSPKDNFSFLNNYLERISPIIRTHHGFIYQYIGDAIMALFAGPVDRAIQAAIEMQQTVHQHNLQQIKNLSPVIQIGIGLHHDEVMLGIIGEQERMGTTIISPAVDITMRLEELTKLYGASILISETTLNALEDASRFEIRFIDKIKVKNREKGLDIFEVLNGDPIEVMEQKIKTRSDFEQGLKLYQQKSFVESKDAFERVLAIDPDDQSAWLYKQRVARSMTRQKKNKKRA